MEAGDTDTVASSSEVPRRVPLVGGGDVGTFETLAVRVGDLGPKPLALRVGDLGPDTLAFRGGVLRPELLGLREGDFSLGSLPVF